MESEGNSNHPVGLLSFIVDDWSSQGGSRGTAGGGSDRDSVYAGGGPGSVPGGGSDRGMKAHGAPDAVALSQQHAEQQQLQAALRIPPSVGGTNTIALPRHHPHEQMPASLQPVIRITPTTTDALSQQQVQQQQPIVHITPTTDASGSVEVRVSLPRGASLRVSSASTSGGRESGERAMASGSGSISSGDGSVNVGGRSGSGVWGTTVIVVDYDGGGGGEAAGLREDDPWVSALGYEGHMRVCMWRGAGWGGR